MGLRDLRQLRYFRAVEKASPAVASAAVTIGIAPVKPAKGNISFAIEGDAKARTPDCEFIKFFVWESPLCINQRAIIIGIHLLNLLIKGILANNLGSNQIIAIGRIHLVMFEVEPNIPENQSNGFKLKVGVVCIRGTVEIGIVEIGRLVEGLGVGKKILSSR